MTSSISGCLVRAITRRPVVIACPSSSLVSRFSTSVKGASADKLAVTKSEREMSSAMKIYLKRKKEHDIFISIPRRFTTWSKHNSGKDKIQNDKMQKGQNTKRQNTNMTKCKTTKCKYDKMQKDRMPIRQNTKRQFTNMTKHKKTEHKSDNTQYDKIQI